MEGVVRMTNSFWPGRRVLVTGATGLIGSWLTRALIDRDAKVVALVRDMDPQAELIRSGTLGRTTVVNGRLEDSGDVERAVVDHEVDTIFHLGAQAIVSVGLRSPRGTLEANIAGTWNVLDAARLHPDLVERVVVASSDKAYGAATDLPYTEDMPVRAGSPYDVSKACTDLVTQSYSLTYGVPAAIARCGNVYGGGDLNWSRIVPGTLRSLFAGEKPVLRSDGTFRRDYLYVDDVVDAYLCLAEALPGDGVTGEAFNFSDESPLTVWEIYTATCTTAGFGEVEPIVLGQASHEIRDQYLASTKARRVLAWKCGRSLDDGLRDTVAWYRAYFGRDSA